MPATMNAGATHTGTLFNEAPVLFKCTNLLTCGVGAIHELLWFMTPEQLQRLDQQNLVTSMGGTSTCRPCCRSDAGSDQTPEDGSWCSCLDAPDRGTMALRPQAASHWCCPAATVTLRSCSLLRNQPQCLHWHGCAHLHGGCSSTHVLVHAHDGRPRCHPSHASKLHAGTTRGSRKAAVGFRRGSTSSTGRDGKHL